MVQRRTCALAALGVLALTVTWGCNASGGPRPPLGKVHGKVSYNGKAVPRGTISFTPVEGEKGNASGMAAAGQIQSDGSYELTTFDTGDGAVLGQHFVTITTQAEMTEPMKTMPPPSEALKYAQGQRMIPEKYSDPKKTPLRYTVDKGDNNIDIALKD